MCQVFIGKQILPLYVLFASPLWAGLRTIHRGLHNLPIKILHIQPVSMCRWLLLFRADRAGSDSPLSGLKLSAACSFRFTPTDGIPTWESVALPKIEKSSCNCAFYQLYYPHRNAEEKGWPLGVARHALPCFTACVGYLVRLLVQHISHGPCPPA